MVGRALHVRSFHVGQGAAPPDERPGSGSHGPDRRFSVPPGATTPRCPADGRSIVPRETCLEPAVGGSVGGVRFFGRTRGSPAAVTRGEDISGHPAAGRSMFHVKHGGWLAGRAGRGTAQPGSRDVGRSTSADRRRSVGRSRTVTLLHLERRTTLGAVVAELGADVLSCAQCGVACGPVPCRLPASDRAMFHVEQRRLGARQSRVPRSGRFAVVRDGRRSRPRPSCSLPDDTFGVSRGTGARMTQIPQTKRSARPPCRFGREPTQPSGCVRRASGTVVGRARMVSRGTSDAAVKP